MYLKGERVYLNHPSFPDIKTYWTGKVKKDTRPHEQLITCITDDECTHMWQPVVKWMRDDLRRWGS